MADSLRDQLLKSGLVQKLKAEAREARPAETPRRPGPPRRVERQATPSRPKPRAGRTQDEIDLARAYGLRERAEREQREREKKLADDRAREKSERKQKLAALLEGKSLNRPEAEIPRHFAHAEKIRRIYCTAGQLLEVNSGTLAVVQYRGRYLLVARETAEQARDISPESLVLLCDPNAAPEDDIPADLIW